jgi:hypothetical protein
MVRRRFNLPEGAELQFIPLVDPALRQLAYDVARDPSLRDWLLTDPATTTATLDADGVADLEPLIEDPRILLECLQYGDIYPPVASGYPTQPFRLVDNVGLLQLSGGYDSLILKAAVSGHTLKTKSPDGNATPLVGDISFNVNYWPTLAQLPEMLVEKLVWGNWWQTGEPKSENAEAA